MSEQEEQTKVDVPRGAEDSVAGGLEYMKRNKNRVYRSFVDKSVYSTCPLRRGWQSCC